MREVAIFGEWGQVGRGTEALVMQPRRVAPEDDGKPGVRNKSSLYHRAVKVGGAWGWGARSCGKHLYVGSHAAEGTGVVIPCRLCTSSRRVVKQMMSVAVVFNVVFSHWRRGPQRRGRQWE